MQVLLEHVHVHNTNKTGKIDETHSMARIYKAESKNVNGVVDKTKKSRSANKFPHITPGANPKMKHYYKHNVVVNAKQMKLNKLYVKQIAPLKNATAFRMNESKLVVKKYKMKPHV
jgi:hypothetical protein